MDKKYFESLTWLRAIAAFFVVVSHSIRTSEVKYAINDEASYFFPLSMLDLGTFGVYLFFALSGCTLFISSHRKVNGINDFLPFYVKRFMRIWPAFAISLILYLIFIEIFKIYYFADTNLWVASLLKDYSVLNIFQYLSLTFNITGPKGLFAGPYWSLPVEFQYYLLLPPALLLMKVKYMGFVSPLLFGSVLYLLYHYHDSIFQIDRLEVFKMGYAFFGGVLLAKYHQRINYKIPFKYSLVVFLFIILFIGSIRTGIIVVPDNISFLSDRWNLYGLFALISALLALLTTPPTKKIGLLVFLHRYGEVSYSIYLFHMIFVGIAALLVINFEIYGDSLKLFFVLFFSLICSYIFSLITYRYIEAPSMAIGRRISKYNE